MAHEYSARKARCRETAAKKMATIASGYMLRTLFTAWLEDYKVTRRARRWFREQGGGEGEESEEEKDWYWPEGDDPVSSLPRNIAVKVAINNFSLIPKVPPLLSCIEKIGEPGP